MRKEGIYFIGGASASGKSVCASMLAEEYSLHLVELDRLYRVIKPTTSNNTLWKELTRDVAAFFVESCLEKHISGIFEGGWINPRISSLIVESYGQHFCPVYCGYPNADINVRLEMIIRDGKHWLAKKEKEEASEWLREQIKGSLWYQNECKKYNIQFFDFSDINIGSQQLQNHYRSWQKSDDFSSL